VPHDTQSVQEVLQCGVNRSRCCRPALLLPMTILPNLSLMSRKPVVSANTWTSHNATIAFHTTSTPCPSIQSMLQLVMTHKPATFRLQHQNHNTMPCILVLLHMHMQLQALRLNFFSAGSQKSEGLQDGEVTKCTAMISLETVMLKAVWRVMPFSCAPWPVVIPLRKRSLLHPIPDHKRQPKSQKTASKASNHRQSTTP